MVITRPESERLNFVWFLGLNLMFFCFPTSRWDLEVS